MSSTIEVSNAPSEAEERLLKQRFENYLASRYPDLPPESEDQRFILRSKSETDDFIGGISCNMFWDGLEIDTLWVDERYRNFGIGSDLVKSAEKLAFEKGAVVAYLKTVDAKEFYEKLGYKVYGVLEDRPVGSKLYHLKKRLR